MDANPGRDRRKPAKRGAGRLWRGQLAVLILALSAPGWAQAQPLQSTHDMSRLKPEAADRTVRRDLLSILSPVKEIIAVRSVIGDVAVRTRPYGTHFAGLCRRDVLTLLYAPTSNQGRSQDWPVQPYGVEARAEFHALRVPAALPNGVERSQDAWREDCDRLPGGDDEGWFAAQDADEAVAAIAVLAAAAERLRAGQVKADCEIKLTPGRSCEQTILAEADPAKVTELQACQAPVGAFCDQILVGGGLTLSIVWRFGAAANAPPQVSAIKAEFYVVVT